MGDWVPNFARRSRIRESSNFGGGGGRTRANSVCFTKNVVKIGAFPNATPTSKIWKNLSVDQKDQRHRSVWVIGFQILLTVVALGKAPILTTFLVKQTEFAQVRPPPPPALPPVEILLSAIQNFLQAENDIKISHSNANRATCTGSANKMATVYILRVG